MLKFGPPEGWVKLNCDGSQNNRMSIAGCGGLLRDSKWQMDKGIFTEAWSL
ncbi:hypothetical protein A2U01_0112478 [Trifolium medium]|uniref:Uncharacterized protein n=1 Tax=Trifolium medium TaxID=97028 RepID=A0A392VS24_9FABA|nr:hypothetical protein [Trifolium medium]